ARAKFDGPRISVHTRVAEHQGNIYLDLADADWRAIEITPAGWQIVEQPPVRFRRTTGRLPLLEPKPGGTVKLLRPFVNCASDAGFRAVVAWLVGCLRPGRPFPVLSLRGEQGSAKTFLAKLLRSLIDPNKAPMRRPPRDDRDLIIAATNGWVV